MDKKETPLVSVVMASYNSMPYIKEAIESVLNQTYRNFEFIIVDGHSNDGTLELIEEYSNNDDRIKLLFDNGKGVGEANAIGCRAAKGKYIAKFDSDDLCYPDRIEKQVSFLECHEEFVLVSSPVNIIDSKGNFIRRTFACTDVDTLMKSLLKEGLIIHSMSMFRKDVYENTEGYLSIKMLEDYLFLSRLWRKGLFYNFSTPLGAYRERADSLFHEKNPYSRVIRSFVDKMILDEEILYSDIDLYNQLCDYSRRFVVKEETKDALNKKGKMYLLFSFLCKLFGYNASERALTYLTNKHCKKKYC